MASIVNFYLLKDIFNTQEMALVVHIYAIFILLLLFSILFGNTKEISLQKLRDGANGTYLPYFYTFFFLYFLFFLCIFHLQCSENSVNFNFFLFFLLFYYFFSMMPIFH